MPQSIFDCGGLLIFYGRQFYKLIEYINYQQEIPMTMPMVVRLYQMLQQLLLVAITLSCMAVMSLLADGLPHSPNRHYNGCNSSSHTTAFQAIHSFHLPHTPFWLPQDDPAVCELCLQSQISAY